MDEQLPGEINLDVVPSDSTARSEPVQISQVKYDIDQARENTRLLIAVSLLAALGVVVAGAMTATAFALWGELRTGKPDAIKTGFDHVKDMTQIVFGPIVALVSAATGFYFGTGSATATARAAQGAASTSNTRTTG